MLELVKQIVDENVMNVVRTSMEHPGRDTAHGGVEETLINIITTEKTDLRASCKFDMSLRFTGTDSQGHNVDTTKLWSKNNVDPLTYTVEYTDDEKLYVTVYGLK